MHHVTLDAWSHGHSILHSRDARAKIAATLVFLVALATSQQHLWQRGAGFAALLAAALALGRLPVGGVLARSAVVLPFAAVFAAISAFSGDGERAAALLVKSYLSAAAALILVATTPLPELLAGLERLGIPRFLLMVTQFVYRYLFVISEEAQHMRIAAACRGGLRARAGFRAAAGAIAALFARSYARAESIHHAMLARGFQGRFPLLRLSRLTALDAAFFTLAAALCILVRLSV